MENKIFKEYRCLMCGKLLFKGVLLLSTVEVKCRKCREIRSYKSDTSPRPISFVLAVNENGRLEEASREAEYVLSYPRDSLLSKSIADICPGFVVSDIKRISPEKPYFLKENKFLLHDGTNMSAETYIVRNLPGSFRMINVVNPEETR